METIKIFYGRVSKEDNSQDITQQMPVVMKKFGVDQFDKIFEEEGSAYKVEKMIRRKKFLEMCDFIFGTKKITDIFMQKVRPRIKIEIYVWDYNRIMRLFEYQLFFLVLSDFFNVEIFSYRQTDIKKIPGETAVQKLMRYTMQSFHSFAAESYSENISDNTKKAVKLIDGITSSNKEHPKKWGRHFKATDNNPNKNDEGKVRFEPSEASRLNTYIKDIFKRFKRRNIVASHKTIIRNVAREFKIIISPAFVSKIKKEMNLK